MTDQATQTAQSKHLKKRYRAEAKLVCLRCQKAADDAQWLVAASDLPPL